MAKNIISLALIMISLTAFSLTPKEKTAAQLAQEDVTYTINNKATLLMPVEGSKNSGFLYFVKWYDENNFHELECANMHYSSQINEAVIELAKRIDS